MSKNKVEVDCTRRCKSRSHGQALTSAITKRSTSDKVLASYIKATCANFVKAFDFEGRTALHMAASRGRVELMAWLARHSSEAFANARDRESGYTPLHRSIFYGQITAAVNLLKMGVNTDIVDKDDYKALEHAMLDRHYMYRNDGLEQPSSDVYVWGSNSNYTLGTGSQQHRNAPELLGSFNKTSTCVHQVCLGKFHSVWVGNDTTEGEVWVCGQMARAGGPHSTALQPVPLKLSEPCVQAAVMLNSTVFLLESGSVVQYSLNSTDNVSQSAAKSCTSIKLPYAKSLIKLSKPLGVVAGRSHAVVWNARAVYTWGINHGQLGHSQEDKVVPSPKRVAISINSKDEAVVQLAAAGDAATVMTTSRGDVYLLHKYLCKKIAVKQISLKQICVDAKVSEQGVYSRVTVLMLTFVGQLLIWQDTTNKLTRCVFGLSHQTVINQVTLTHDALFFVTKYGEAFVGTISRKTEPSQPVPIKKEKERDNNKSALVKFLDKDDCTRVRIQKIPNIHRAVSIAVDAEGLNFACIQVKPTCGIRSAPDLSPSSFGEHMQSFMESATDDDQLHDVVFKVGTKLYPAHIFIVASSSEYLYKLYQDQLTEQGAKPTVTLDNVHPEVFDRILRYMYTGTCDVAEPGPCGLKIRREDLPSATKKGKESPENIYIDLLESEMYNSKISPERMPEEWAFEPDKQWDEDKKTRARRSTVTPPRRSHCDPVRLIQASAKRLQVKGLLDLLDQVFYRDGTVYLKNSAPLENPTLSWNREAFPALVDTHVCSQDGELIPAHKCVLVPRLEYFHGMFMHSWTESKETSKVTLPINHYILLPAINFLYTDWCPEVETSESIDFLTSMLVVADQLFITRLREMCETALAELLTLRNCAELCQFASLYNAPQLKQCCMEFICLNLCSILENRTLEVLEDSLLNDISKYYCQFNPIMSSRVITPFFNAPSDEVVEELASTYPVDLEYTDEDVRNDSVIEITKKKPKSSKKIEYTESEKARMRYESVSSVTSLDLSNEVSEDITLSLSNISKQSEKGARDKQEKWIAVPSAQQQKHLKAVQSRLKAVSNARDILNEPPVEQFTKLVKTNSLAIARSNSQENNVPTSSRMSVSPKDSPIAEMARSPQGSLIISHVASKLSQKQRKRLALQGNEPINMQNLSDFLSNKLNVETTPEKPEKPKNPWKICEPPVASSSPRVPKTIEFNQILTDQKKQKEDFSRIMTKPLALTQLEDKAIEELERFYNVHQIDDEIITVRRIELSVSSPQWILQRSPRS